MDFLKAHAQNIVTDRDLDIHEEEYRQVERCALLLSRLQEQMDATAFLRRARDMVGKAESVNLNSVARRRPYLVAFMLRALTMADLLRSSGDLRKSLEASLELLMPEVLQPAFRTLVAESRAAFPHPSTISRWRLLLDGAFMLVERKQNSHNHVVRHMMADASTQHGHHVEHILVRCIREEQLVSLFDDALRLQQLWSESGE